jgi:hypothetical protein
MRMVVGRTVISRGSCPKGSPSVAEFIYGLFKESVDHMVTKNPIAPVTRMRFFGIDVS